MVTYQLNMDLSSVSPINKEVSVMPKIEEMTVEKLKDLKEAWLHAWCVAVQSHSIRDSDYAAIWADASAETYARNNQH